MEFSEYENIEIFNNTQSFVINKCENQTIRETEAGRNSIRMILNPTFLILLNSFVADKLYI
jgi:hypothetical protein